MEKEKRKSGSLFLWGGDVERSTTSPKKEKGRGEFGGRVQEGARRGPFHHRGREEARRKPKSGPEGKIVEKGILNKKKKRRGMGGRKPKRNILEGGKYESC